MDRRCIWSLGKACMNGKMMEKLKREIYGWKKKKGKQMGLKGNWRRIIYIFEKDNE